MNSNLFCLVVNVTSSRQPFYWDWLTKWIGQTEITSIIRNGFTINFDKEVKFN